jgi:hypothetical protein
MIRKLAIFSVCCAIALWATSVSFSQDATDEGTTAPAAETTDDTVKADDTAKTDDTAKADETTPQGPVSNADKAKSYFDGAFTYVNSKALFKLTARDNFMADKIMYKLDDGEEQTYDKEFAIIEEGKHTISYYGIDKIGNKEDGKIYHIIVDNTAPEILLTPAYPLYQAEGKYYISKRFSFNISATDALSGVNKVSYTVNGKDFSDYVTAFSIYTDGDVAFSVTGEDNVGNKSAKFRIKLAGADGKEAEAEKESLQLFVDNIAPTVTITADKQLLPFNGKNVAAKDYKYTASAADKESGLKTVYVRVDGRGDFVPFDKEIFFSTNGDHFIEAKATDNVGNFSDTVILPVYVDVIPPDSNINAIVE